MAVAYLPTGSSKKRFLLNGKIHRNFRKPRTLILVN
jgi:hypothetical protein